MHGITVQEKIKGMLKDFGYKLDVNSENGINVLLERVIKFIETGNDWQ